MAIAYWISPKGKIIDVQSKHIAEVIRYPEKFGLNREAIDFIYDTYNERIGQEGKARYQIMMLLFNKGWIRLRRYKQFWSINVKKLAGRTKSYVTDWAQKVLKGLHGFTENDPTMPVKIDQGGSSKVKTTDVTTMAQSDKFIPEHHIIECKINDLPDLPLYEEVSKIGKRKTFKEYLNET